MNWAWVKVKAYCWASLNRGQKKARNTRSQIPELHLWSPLRSTSLWPRLPRAGMSVYSKWSRVGCCCEQFVKGSHFLGFVFFSPCVCAFLHGDTGARTTETRLRLNLEANVEFSFSFPRQETVVDTKSHFASFLFRCFNQDSVSGTGDFFSKLQTEWASTLTGFHGISINYFFCVSLHENTFQFFFSL